MTGSRAIRCTAAATASRCALERAETSHSSSARASRPATRAQLIVPNAASCAQRGSCELVPEIYLRIEMCGAAGVKEMYRYTLEA